MNTKESVSADRGERTGRDAKLCEETQRRSTRVLSIASLRTYAIARSLFAPTTLRRAIERLGFVQADPIRAPARAQDLILRHRVKNYREGDLDRRYQSLAIDEDHFVNYGFLPQRLVSLLHPRPATARPVTGTSEQVAAMLAFASEHGEIHPRTVAARFSLGRVENYWGGQSRATTQMLERLHYGGLLRVARRVDGIRVYTPRATERAPAPERAHAPGSAANGTATAAALDAQSQAEALVQLVVALYAPLPASSLTHLVGKLGYAAPQLRSELSRVRARAKQWLNHATLGGTPWFWPASERPGDYSLDSAAATVRLLAPFDPVVWDRRRFEAFWGWPYRFEAYTPSSRRRLGYYALPLLWRDRVIGWGNLAVNDGRLQAQFGYRPRALPKSRLFRRELAAELERFAGFLARGVSCGATHSLEHP